MWKLAFWKDTFERALGTALAAVLGLITVDGFNWTNLDAGQAAGAVGTITLITVIKCMLAGLASPNTGGSMLGTSVPSGQVVAAVDVKSEETVAADASSVPNGTPVHVVTDLPPVPPVS